MICRRCGKRIEYKDCSYEEKYYKLCDICISDLNKIGELYIWDKKYKYSYKKLDGDIWELYLDKINIARVHKDDIKKLCEHLNNLYKIKTNYYLKMNELRDSLKNVLINFDDGFGGEDVD